MCIAESDGTVSSSVEPSTVHSVPRLMPGQGVIVGVGAMEYPAEWQGASPEAIVRNAVSKILTLTSTYDHRIIQGAQSGEFLRRIHGTAPEPVSADSAPETAEGPPKRLKLSRLPKMSKRARDMLNRAITAYMDRDADKAAAIVKRDQKINRHYRKFFAEAMQTMHTQSIAELPTYLLWIAHNLERIGDRTTNLAERVVFMVTGQYTEVLEDYE